MFYRVVSFLQIVENTSKKWEKILFDEFVFVLHIKTKTWLLWSNCFKTARDSLPSPAFRSFLSFVQYTLAFYMIVSLISFSSGIENKDTWWLHKIRILFARHFWKKIGRNLELLSCQKMVLKEGWIAFNCLNFSSHVFLLTELKQKVVLHTIYFRVLWRFKSRSSLCCASNVQFNQDIEKKVIKSWQFFNWTCLYISRFVCRNR